VVAWLFGASDHRVTCAVSVTLTIGCSDQSGHSFRGNAAGSGPFIPGGLGALVKAFSVLVSRRRISTSSRSGHRWVSDCVRARSPAVRFWVPLRQRRVCWFLVAGGCSTPAKYAMSHRCGSSQTSHTILKDRNRLHFCKVFRCCGALFSAIFGWCDLHGFISTWLLRLWFASLSVGTVGGGLVLLVSETTSSEVASVWCRHSALGRVCPGSTWPPPVGVCSWVLACAIVSSSTVYHFSHLPPRPCGDTGVGFLQAITTRRRFPAQPPRCVGFSCVYHCYGMGGRLQLV